MGSEIVIALYKAKPGHETDLEKLIQQHVPILRELELITSRPRLTMKSANGTYMEVIEWANIAAAESAHEHPAVAKIWEGMAVVSEFCKLNDLSEAAKAFTHFKVVPHLSESFQ
jgi:hypothetical protein